MDDRSANELVIANVRHLMAARGYSIWELSDLTGIGRQTLGRRLSGKIPFYVRELIVIAVCCEAPSIRWMLEDHWVDGI